MAATISSKIERRIQKQGEGWVFAAQDFLDLGSRAAVDQTLSRLAREGEIRRVGRGLYDLPRTSTLLGTLVPPAQERIAEALERKTGSRLQSSGAVAANALGLSTQVPAKIVYLTDGASRKLKVGGQTIELRHAEPRRLTEQGGKVATILEALRYLGPTGIDDHELTRLRALLTRRDRATLRRSRATAPTWLLPHIDRLLENLA
ncbi:DUF6088 family protein [Armatimonas sp.]|uniref:DUF6088 family protein n=1 Tax=Armatimonas sp. TaxID=1872638 RepID=UPI00286A6FAF|nr:DUF6088 family protein [Armatimonas sp.]